jgi:hypothetical protein
MFEPVDPWRGSSMLDWIVDWFLKIVTAGPAWLYEEGTANFTIFRAMMGVMILLLIAYLIAIRRK